VVAEASGAILIADTLNHRIVRWIPGAKSGTLVFGGRGCGQRLDQLNQPTSLTFDSAGNLLICDTGNHRILRLPREKLNGLQAIEAERVADGNPSKGDDDDDDADGAFEDDFEDDEPDDKADDPEPWISDVIEDLKQHFKPIRSGMSLEDLYNRLLAASNGQLSLDKFTVVVRTYRPDLSDAACSQLFSTVNSSGSGSISLAEFLACFS